MTQITPTAATGQPQLNASADPEFSPLAIAPIPTVLGTSTDAARQFYRMSVSQLRMPPLPVASLIAAGAASESHAVAVQPAAVTPAAPVTQVTDGLIHGDKIWEVDPAYVIWRDDFQFGGVTGGVDAPIGDLNWDTASTGFTQLTRWNSAFPHLGQFQVLSNATSNDFFWMTNPIYNSSCGYLLSTLPLLENPGWKLVWVFNIGGFPQTTGTETITKTSMYIGLTCPSAGSAGGLWDIASASGTNARPPYFIGVRFDTDATSPAISDSTFKLEVVGNYNIGNSRNNAQGTVFDTGVVPSKQGDWYALEITCDAVGIVSMSFTDDKGTSLCPRTTPQTFTCPEMVCTASASAPQLVFSVGNGWNEITQSNLSSGTTPYNTNFCWGGGSKITIAAASGGIGVYNGSCIVTQEGNASSLFWPGTQVATGVANAGMTVTGYPALSPFIVFGNSSESSPTAARVIEMDFFSFVANPGVGGGSGTPNPLKSRYW